MRLDKGKWRAVLVFLGPALLLYTIFVVYPTLEALRMSLYDWRGLSAAKAFIGVGNFLRLTQDRYFLNSFTNSLVVVGVGVSVSLMLALFFAEMLSKNIRFAGSYRAILLFPNVLADVVVAVLWRFIYNPTFGALNGLLQLVGFRQLVRAWLGEPKTALFAVIAPVIWKWLGFYVIMFYGSIRNIDKGLYEAADVDGVNGWQRFYLITLPLLSRTLQVAIVFMVVQSFSVVFAFVQIMTNGGPDRATEVVQIYLYRQAFVHGNFGYGTAIGVVTLFALLLISTGSRRIVKILEAR